MTMRRDGGALPSTRSAAGQRTRSADQSASPGPRLALGASSSSPWPPSRSAEGTRGSLRRRAASASCAATSCSAAARRFDSATRRAFSDASASSASLRFANASCRLASSAAFDDPSRASASARSASDASARASASSARFAPSDAAAAMASCASSRARSAATSFAAQSRFSATTASRSSTTVAARASALAARASASAADALYSWSRSVSLRTPSRSAVLRFWTKPLASASSARAAATRSSKSAGRRWTLSANFCMPLGVIPAAAALRLTTTSLTAFLRLLRNFATRLSAERCTDLTTLSVKESTRSCSSAWNASTRTRFTDLPPVAFFDRTDLRTSPRTRRHPSPMSAQTRVRRQVRWSPIISRKLSALALRSSAAKYPRTTRDTSSGASRAAASRALTPFMTISRWSSNACTKTSPPMCRPGTGWHCCASWPGRSARSGPTRKSLRTVSSGRAALIAEPSFRLRYLRKSSALASVSSLSSVHARATGTMTPSRRCRNASP
mmetsp:Transcript_16183/g.55857  ORF Transcript_16183/g.55857 Transcript_16183/m.55857 type:complete len:500 (-) Transcript_16183:758-2257(-)